MSYTPTDAADAEKVPIVEAVKQQVQELPSRAGQVVDLARSQLKSQLSDQKDRAVKELDSMARALHEAGKQMEDHLQNPAGRYAEAAAEQVDRLSGFLREQDVDAFLQQTADFARSRPALFLGSAFAIGFLAARFLKSSGSPGSSYRSEATTRNLPAPFIPPATAYTGAPASESAWNGMNGAGSNGNEDER
jgi:ElaB/YqjD/DUF883 family membrane-anchored ribosome-binding protein